MSIVLAVVAVTVGSVLLRVVPLLAARRLPDAAGRLAGWAGAAVLAALAARGVARHEDPALPFAPPYAVAAMAVALVAAFRDRSVFVSLGAGAATYVALSAATVALARVW